MVRQPYKSPAGNSGGGFFACYQTENREGVHGVSFTFLLILTIVLLFGYHLRQNRFFKPIRKNSSQSRQINRVCNWWQCGFFYEGGHINRQVNGFVDSAQIIVAEHYSILDLVIGIGQDISQGVVALVVFARLHLNGNDLAVLLYDKVQFTLLLAVEVIQL